MDNPEKKNLKYKNWQLPRRLQPRLFEGCRSNNNKEQQTVLDCWFRWRRVNIGVQLTQQELWQAYGLL